MTISFFIQPANSTCIENVVASLTSAQKNKSKIKIDTQKVFSQHEFKLSLKNKWGSGNHLQGIQVIENGVYAVLSGADFKQYKSWLFLIDLKLKKIIKRIGLPTKKNRWHVGGLGYSKGVIVVPKETYKTGDMGSGIHFYNLNVKNKELEKLPLVIEQAVDRAGAVDLIKKPNGLYDLFVFDETKFYLYENINPFAYKTAGEYKKITYQNTAFWTSNTDMIKQCDGQEFFMAMNNFSLLPFLLRYQNGIRLFKFDRLSEKPLRLIKTFKFPCDGYCNFRGAVGSFFRDEKLALMATTMYRPLYKDILRLTKFFE